MGAPEERHGVELGAPLPSRLSRRGLAHALGDHPVLDAHGSRRAASGSGRRRRRRRCPGRSCEGRRRRATPRSIARPAASASAIAGARRCRTTTRSASAVRRPDSVTRARLDRRAASARGGTARRVLVQVAHEVADLGPSTRASGCTSGATTLHLEAARAQRGRGLESDEARADDDPLRSWRARDDGAAVGERAQRVDVRQVGAGHDEAHRSVPVARSSVSVGSVSPSVGQRARRRPASSARPRAPSAARCAARRRSRGAQRHPFLGRAAGEVVLRQVRPINGRRGVGADQRR